MQTFKVAAASNVKKVGAAIAKTLEEENIIALHGIGAGAVNQIMKAIAIANGFVAPQGKEVICKPMFIDIREDAKVQGGTAIRILTTMREAKFQEESEWKH